MGSSRSNDGMAFVKTLTVFTYGRLETLQVLKFG